MMKRNLAISMLAWLLPSLALAQQVDEAAMGEAVERHLGDGMPFTQWVQDPSGLAIQEGDRLEVRAVIEEKPETVKLTGLVPAIHFASGVAEIPEGMVEELARILESMRHRKNVRLHLVGHADNQPLSPRLQGIYGDNYGLSRERAGQVAEYFQNALGLPPEAVSYAWEGESKPVASNDTEQGRAQNRRVEVEVWYDEFSEAVGQEEILVPHQLSRVKVCRMETVCKLRYVEGHARRARLQNVVAPLHFSDEGVDVTPRFVEQVQQAMSNLADRQNVTVKFIGHTDDTPLMGRTQRIYGDPLGLSKARARRVALAVQDTLSLPTAAVDSDGRGAERPLGSNDTAQGRALNRRIEVEFWYDDPLQELPEEPQLCPDSPGAELVTKVYDPSWGSLPTIDFNAGQPAMPEGYGEVLGRALRDVASRKNPRLRFVGYTRNERLDRRTAVIYGDDIGLSAARARRVMERVGEEMGLPPGQMEFEGRGYVHSQDVVNAGFIQGDSSYVAVQVVYDELAVLDDFEGVDVTRITREISPRNPLGLNLMRITVDGVPIDDPQRSSADIQRCTDVAFDQSEIQFRYDNLKSAPRLSVSAEPAVLGVPEVPVPDQAAPSVQFRMYTNYAHFIERAEVLIFAAGQSLESDPLARLDIELDGVAGWQPDALLLQPPARELAYVVRAYGKDGNFDQTSPQPLWLVSGDAGIVPEAAGADPAVQAPGLMAAYGESGLASRNIGLSSGTVGVRGMGIPPGYSVWVAGRQVPVDANGRFVAEEILPQGQHTVEVAVLDGQDNGRSYLRDLELKSSDWFYTGIADLTLSYNDSEGPVELMSGDSPLVDPDSGADGRLAFYVNGKFNEHWRLSASADTREGPVDELFSNFMSKSPDSLFRRIDPDYYYPTFGDDSTVEEMTPTMGKFFVRLSEGDNYGMWGNFKVGYMNNELAQVDRGLYGASGRYRSDATTSFGENRFGIDAFAAEPGTVPSREEFRGTGGSLYYLQRQDILPGSERLRIEVRDKASGVVTGVVNLTPVLDYDIDYLQGRVMLSEPLASTVDDSLLVRSNALSGDEAYLVARYEYSPGFDEIDALAAGGQAHYWFGDFLRLGLTANANDQDGADSTLQAADLTLRMSANTWLKLQGAQSEGLVSSSLRSDDGGYAFYGDSGFADVSTQAGAYRADLSMDTNELVDFGDSRLTFYMQQVEAGYSAPGLAANKDTRSYGATFQVPIKDRLTVTGKVDSRIEEQGLQTRVQEYNLGYQLNSQWDVKAGYRFDDRVDTSPLVPLTQKEGERADAVVQVGYNSMGDWTAYGFVQDTVSSSGTRDENGRVGVGGSYLAFESLRINAEVSDGDLGPGGKLGTTYMHSERTSLYLNYSLENERTDNGMRGGRGAEGNLVTGMKTRFSDSTSVFLEERYQHGRTMTGLTHSTGVSLAPTQRLNLGMNTDIGTLQDMQTGAETDRRAAAVRIGYGFEKLQLSSGIEYRFDEQQQLDLSASERTTWLFRSNFKYQMTPGARLLGKFNWSDSDSSLGNFYDGGFTEAVLGYAYRPVAHDRLNALAKYTYFYNVPTTDQVTLQNTAAEYIQVSHIGSVDLTYDLTQSLSVGGKYAYRLGEISLDREQQEFFDNSASLYVVRMDWTFRDNWEATAEGRMLDMGDLDQRRSGALLVISRYIGDHVKVGLGYNFTDFSDDLTDLDYDHQGVFLNLTGAM